jgi:alkanesulfonate monooxygenase SsuD/methylene tetrahydromethanopterin reductase-like flavin-dependent oxidoreductase (luciferase family)
VADNLSGGRVGIGCASGWHASDFALHPDRFTDRTEIAFQHLEDVRRLWRGESVARHTGEGHPIDVRLHPRPVQELPPDLSFGLAPRRDPAKGYRTFLEYSADLWDPATAQELLDDWQAVLAELCTRPDAPVAPLLNPLQPLRKA